MGPQGSVVWNKQKCQIGKIKWRGSSHLVVRNKTSLVMMDLIDNGCETIQNPPIVAFGH